MANIIQTFPKGAGAGGGHTILDTDGTSVAQESKMQFVGASVTDDATNGITKVAGAGLNQDSIDDIADANTQVPAVIIGDANNYSTSEKVIGKWVDGKPIYQKTIRFSFSYGTNSYNIATLNNIDTMINLTGYINEDGTYFNINNFNCRLQYISSTGLLQWRAISSSTWGASVCQATIQYTKTTD